MVRKKALIIFGQGFHRSRVTLQSASPLVDSRTADRNSLHTYYKENDCNQCNIRQWCSDILQEAQQQEGGCS
eukprot:9477257-Pyramimonas_sp.AAC.1